MIRAEVIAIGDELTSGQRLDTNSQWLSQRLEEMGLTVMFHSTVGDDLDANVRVFREAVDRADTIVTTGGLGPTADDLTRQAMAEASGRPLELDEASLAHIRALFSRRARPMPPQNEIQAHFPRGSQVIPNPHGSAPGIDLTCDRPGRGPARIFSLPGVPAEMREMWEQTVRAAIERTLHGPRQMIRHREIKCFGVGESDLEQMLPDLIRRGRDPRVGITVSQATITLRVTARGPDEASCLEKMQPTIETINDCLGSLVFGRGDDQLEDALVVELGRLGRTMASIEWDAGGLLARGLSQADPDGRHFLGGMVLHTGQAAASLFPTLQAAGAITDSDVEQMVRTVALNCRNQFAADYGLVLGPFPRTGTRGPFPRDGTVGGEQPLRFAMALASADDVVVESKPFVGHPAILEARAVKLCLNMARLLLKGGP